MVLMPRGNDCSSGTVDGPWFCIFLTVCMLQGVLMGIFNVVLPSNDWFQNDTTDTIDLVVDVD